VNIESSSSRSASAVYLSPIQSAGVADEATLEATGVPATKLTLLISLTARLRGCAAAKSRHRA
jgi:hypothetical protein